MHRTRETDKWDYLYYSSREEFLDAPRTEGAHSVEYMGQQLDLLVIDRNAPATLVSFHGAIPTTVPTYPRFDGQGVAQRTHLNLISVADPSISMGVNLGWHLGNKQIGPLRPILSPLIHHILRSLSSKRIILIGGSGGGFAAAHFAHDFPGSIAFVFNPRLSLERLPRGSIRTYLEICQNLSGTLKIPTEEERSYLEPFGPTDIDKISAGEMNHHLLIYQNLLDKNFLQTQFLPFVSGHGANSRIRVRLDNDGEGHVYIPKPTVDEIVGALSHEAVLEEAIALAGFISPTRALAEVVFEYPEMQKLLASKSLEGQPS